MAVYKALYAYDPADTGEGEGFIALNVGDILEVAVMPDDTQAKEWLHGVNTTTEQEGYFPGPFVEYQGPKRPQPMPRRKNSINDSGYVGSPHRKHPYTLNDML